MDIKIKIGDQYFKDFNMDNNCGRYTGNTQNAYGHEITGIIVGDKKNATVLSAKGAGGKINQILELMRFEDIVRENIEIEVDA